MEPANTMTFIEQPEPETNNLIQSLALPGKIKSRSQMRKRLYYEALGLSAFRRIILRTGLDQVQISLRRTLRGQQGFI
jgi:hypothetical protein